MKEAHSDPHTHAVRGLEGGDVALGSPLIAVSPLNIGGATRRVCGSTMSGCCSRSCTASVHCPKLKSRD